MKSRTPWWLGLIGILTIAMAPPSNADDSKAVPDAKADDASKQADAKPPLVITKFYDVRALLAPSPDFAFDNSSHGGGFLVPANRVADVPVLGSSSDDDGGRNRHVPERWEESDSLIKIVTDLVDSDSWREAGVAAPLIRESQGTLIVTQTAVNQKLVADLLRELSERRHRTVRTTADWLLLKPADVSKLRKKSPGKTNLRGLSVVDPELLEKLAAENIHFHADLLGQEGQAVHFVSGREKSVTVNQVVAVGTDVAAYSPIVASVGGGVALQVNPAIERESDRAVLSILSTYTQMKPPGEPIAVRTAATTRASTGETVIANEASASYREVDGIVQELRSTVRLPLGVPVIVGAMTLEPNADRAQGEVMVLILRVDCAD